MITPSPSIVVRRRSPTPRVRGHRRRDHRRREAENDQPSDRRRERPQRLPPKRGAALEDDQRHRKREHDLRELLQAVDADDADALGAGGDPDGEQEHRERQRRDPRHRAADRGRRDDHRHRGKHVGELHRAATLPHAPRGRKAAPVQRERRDPRSGAADCGGMGGASTGRDGSGRRRS
jgi:hypothetical protein